MRWRRKARSRPVESISPDPRVPPAHVWTSQGIVGRIGSGPDRGSYVLIDPIWAEHVGIGPIVGYTIELPRDQLFDVDGDHLLDDGVYDDMRPPGEGGFIDLLTTALDIEWSVDPEVVAREWSRRAC